MWKLARVRRDESWVTIRIWDSSDTQLRTLESNQKKDKDKQEELWSLYHQAIIDLLKDGWEPFNTGDWTDFNPSVSVQVQAVWFRMKVEE